MGPEKEVRNSEKRAWTPHRGGRAPSPHFIVPFKDGWANDERVRAAGGAGLDGDANKKPLGRRPNRPGGGLSAEAQEPCTGA